MSANPNREAFEQWANQGRFDTTRARAAWQGDYMLAATECAWQGWQASRPHALEEAEAAIIDSRRGKAFEFCLVEVDGALNAAIQGIRALKDQA